MHVAVAAVSIFMWPRLFFGDTDKFGAGAAKFARVIFEGALCFVLVCDLYLLVQLIYIHILVVCLINGGGHFYTYCYFISFCCLVSEREH